MTLSLLSCLSSWFSSPSPVQCACPAARAGGWHSTHTRCPSLRCSIHWVCGPALCWHPFVREVNRNWTQYLFHTNRHKQTSGWKHTRGDIKGRNSVIFRIFLETLPYNVAAVGDVSFLPGVAIATSDDKRWDCRGSIRDKNITCDRMLQYWSLMHLQWACAGKMFVTVGFSGVSFSN